MNLLGPGELGEALLDHVDEALAAVEVARRCGLEDAPWLDVGSGAGLPGLVVASVRPAVGLELVEPRAKRVSFLRMALGAMGRSDVPVWAGRVDDGRFFGEGAGPGRAGFGVLSARAVFEPSMWLGQAMPWIRPDGVVLFHLPVGAGLPRVDDGLIEVAEAVAGRWRVVGARPGSLAS